MDKLIIRSPIFLFLLCWNEPVFANSDRPLCNSLSIITELQPFLSDPEYRTVFFVRHGKATKEGKSTAAERDGNPELQEVDKQRELSNQGRKAVGSLAEVLGELRYGETVFFTSDAKRVRETGLAIYDRVATPVKSFTTESALYYADVEAELFRRMARPENAGVRHAFFCGHGKSTMKVFKKLSGAVEAFNPTAGVMAVAIKAESWNSFINGRHKQIHVFAWSPKETHNIEYESMAGLESLPASGLEALPIRGEPDESLGVIMTRENFSWHDAPGP